MPILSNKKKAICKYLQTGGSEEFPVMKYRTKELLSMN